jgi:hypothetical protein
VVAIDNNQSVIRAHGEDNWVVIRFPREQIDVSCFRQFCRAF